MLLPSRTPVLEADTVLSCEVRKVSRPVAKRMLDREQAKLEVYGNGKCALRLLRPHQAQEHECRTRISSGGPRAAMGLSQDYVIRDSRGIVTDFKRIYPEDRECFHLATIEAMSEPIKAPSKPKPAKVDAHAGGWWFECKGVKTLVESKTAAIGELLQAMREALEKPLTAEI